MGVAKAMFYVIMLGGAVTSQQGGFDPRIARGTFLCGVCVLSPCSCEFPPSAPVSFHSAKDTS